MSELSIAFKRMGSGTEYLAAASRHLATVVDASAHAFAAALDALTPPEIRPFVEALPDSGLYILDDAELILSLIAAAREHAPRTFTELLLTVPMTVTQSTALWRAFHEVIAREDADGHD